MRIACSNGCEDFAIFSSCSVNSVEPVGPRLHNGRAGLEMENPGNARRLHTLARGDCAALPRPRLLAGNYAERNDGGSDSPTSREDSAGPTAAAPLLCPHP